MWSESAVEMLAHKKYELWRVSVTYSTMNQIGRWHVLRHELAGGVIQPLDRVGGNPAPDVLLMDQH